MLTFSRWDVCKCLFCHYSFFSWTYGCTIFVYMFDFFLCLSETFYSLRRSFWLPFFCVLLDNKTNQLSQFIGEKGWFMVSNSKEVSQVVSLQSTALLYLKAEVCFSCLFGCPNLADLIETRCFSLSGEDTIEWFVMHSRKTAHFPGESSHSGNIPVGKLIESNISRGWPGTNVSRWRVPTIIACQERRSTRPESSPSLSESTRIHPVK